MGKIVQTISHILQSINNLRFMTSSLSNLVDNFAEGIHRIKYKYGHDNKKFQTCRIKYKGRDCCVEYTDVKDDLIEWKCLCCNKNYKKKFDKT